MRELPDTEYFSPLYLVFEIQSHYVAQVGLDFNHAAQDGFKLIILCLSLSKIGISVCATKLK